MKSECTPEVQGTSAVTLRVSINKPRGQYRVSLSAITVDAIEEFHFAMKNIVDKHPDNNGTVLIIDLHVHRSMF